MDKPDYSDKKALVEYYSNRYPDNHDFIQFMSERLDYFSDRFGKEHIEFFDLLWKKCKERLVKNKKEYCNKCNSKFDKYGYCPECDKMPWE